MVVNSFTGADTEGTTVSLSGKSGDIRYGNAAGTALNAKLESTTGSGLVTINNVDPGDYTVTVEHADLSCRAANAWHHDEPGVLNVVVEEDTTTQMSVTCDAE